jgi:type I restriction enzyme S subunit
MSKVKQPVPKRRFAGFTDAWEQRKLGEIATISSGFMGDSLLSTGEYRLTRIETISDGEVNETKIGYSNIKPDDSYLLKKNDILYSNINSITHMGKVAQYQGNSILYHGINLLRLSPNDEMFSDFLIQVLNTDEKRNWAKSHANQAVSQASINQSLLGSQNIFVTSFAEQQQIGTYFRNLDNLITLHQRKLEKAKEFKKSCLVEMFPAEGQRKPKRRFSGFSDDWEQRKLSQLGSVITGSTPSTQVQAYYSDIGIPWVTPTDISDNVTFRTAKHLTNEGQKVARVVPKNTILVTSIASIGKNTMLGTTGSFNQQINGLVPNEKENHPYFLFTESAIWSDKMKRSAASGTMQIVNKTEFSEINTYVPTLDEQKQIGECFQHLDNLITLHQRKLDKLKAFKQACLNEMFV